jgi:ZIP family zinc transporter
MAQMMLEHWWMALAARADRSIPHFHPALGFEGPPSRLSRVWLLIFAITIHNFPEGLVVGVSFGSGDVSAGLLIALAIGARFEEPATPTQAARTTR